MNNNNGEWILNENGVYVSRERIPKNKQEKRKFEKEEEQAKILVEKGYKVYLVSELGDGKHYDGIVNGKKYEFKTIDGGENAVSHRFREALEQGENVYLRIRSDIKTKRVKEILKGVLKTKERNGDILCYIDSNKELYKWKMKDLK